MPEKKPVYGIWIKEDETTKNTGSQLIFITEAGVFEPKHPKEWIFLTNKTIKKSIEQYQKLIGTKIGRINIEADKESKLFIVSQFYPFGEEKNSSKPRFPYRKEFEKNGLGTIAFAKLMGALQKKFPDYGFDLTLPNKEMLQMLKNMGIKPAKEGKA